MTGTRLTAAEWVALVAMVALLVSAFVIGQAWQCTRLAGTEQACEQQEVQP